MSLGLKCSPLRTLRPQDVGVNTQKCCTIDRPGGHCQSRYAEITARAFALSKAM